MTWNIYHGNNIDIMKNIQDDTYTSVITDPPYGIGFMNKDWDKALPNKDTWKELLRITKRGGILIAFGAPRMYHRLAVDIEDSGWKLVDCMMWIYGQGFPKSYNISKGIDKRLGTERVTVDFWKATGTARGNKEKGSMRAAYYTEGEREKKKGGEYIPITVAGSEEAKDFEGFGTNLKPAYEPIIIAIKPPKETFVDNALIEGISGFNIDEARIETEENLDRKRGYTEKGFMPMKGGVSIGNEKGRYPSNLLLSHDNRCSDKKCIPSCPKKIMNKQTDREVSRFFYCTKPSQSSREGYLNHPTIKPIDLIEYLIKLVKQPKGRTKILDPFGGSGTTLAAALRQNVDCDTIELDEEYVKMIKKRYVKELKKNSALRFDKKSKRKDFNKFKKFKTKKEKKNV